MRSSGKLVAAVFLLGSAPACTHDPGGGGDDDPFGAGTGTTAASASATTDSAAEDTAAESRADSSSTADDDAWGPKLDVAADTDGACAEAGCGETGCTAVDLLFVIDNSTSMIAHQEALGEAFPAFVDAMITQLPAGTDLHVGVTGTEMGIAQLGVTQDCVATGDGVPAAEYYLTPDEMITDSPSAQGRLHVVDGLPFFAIDTSADPSEIAALSEWFSRAAMLGGTGSPIEMSTAAAGWAADPINMQFNGEFIRDGGAVLVIFFIQDEPDQTPLDAAPDLIGKITAAKSGCGGLECVVAGGLVDEGCLPQVALGELFDALPHEPTVSQLPVAEAIDAATFEAVLADTLVAAVAQTCDEIGPAG